MLEHTGFFTSEVDLVPNRLAALPLTFVHPDSYKAALYSWSPGESGRFAEFINCPEELGEMLGKFRDVPDKG